MKGNFSQLINSEIPVLIDFYAEWCGPCKTQAPILADVAKEIGDKVKIVKINVDKNREIATRFQIRSIPTLVLFKKGKSVWRQSGVADKRQLVGTIKSFI
jgi:thioredoxin 1